MLPEPLLAVTIDTESDNQWDVQGRGSLSFRNIRALPRLEELFEKYGVRPTYLLTYDVASDEESAVYFRGLLRRGNCEIGTHFHPWTTPPVTEEEIKKGVYPHHLPESLHAEKMKRLTEVIEKRIGVRPTSFRAGRWGFNETSVRVLERLGYQVDSSVTPFYSWEKDGGPVFIDAPAHPYFPDKNNVCRQGNGSLLEVPVTIGCSGLLGDLPLPLLRRLRHSGPFFETARRLRLLNLLWLRPSYTSARGMIELSRRTVEKGGRVLTMMFHSSEIAVGSSPHHPTEEALERFFRKLEGILSYLTRERGVRSVTLSEVYRAWVGNGSSC